MSNWDARFIALAEHWAGNSKDPSTKVGCILVHPETNAVAGQGFNGFPRRVRERKILLGAIVCDELDPVRWERPGKYLWIEHAERNAIYNAARHGHPTDGCWAYLNYDPNNSICADCARALIQAGITRVIGPQRQLSTVGWLESCAIAAVMFREAGVQIYTSPAAGL